MDIKKTVGLRINSALARCGVLQKELAKILGVKDNIISYYCSGARGPNLDQLPKIAESLNTTTDYLFGLTNDPNIQKSAVDDLGLTPSVISKLQKIAQLSSSDSPNLGKINRVLEDENVWTLLFLIHDYFTAVKAEDIYNSLVDIYGNNDLALSNALTEAAERYKKTDIDLHDFLLAKAKSHIDGPLIRIGLDESSLSELVYLRIDRQVHKTLTNIDSLSNCYESK